MLSEAYQDSGQSPRRSAASFHERGRYRPTTLTGKFQRASTRLDSGLHSPSHTLLTKLPLIESECRGIDLRSSRQASVLGLSAVTNNRSTFRLPRSFTPSMTAFQSGSSTARRSSANLGIPLQTSYLSLFNLLDQSMGFLRRAGGGGRISVSSPSISMLKPPLTQVHP